MNRDDADIGRQGAGDALFGHALTALRHARQPPRMTTQELPITGYLDRFSHRPGEIFTAFVSMNTSGPYRARLVRVLSGDPNPHGPGVRFEDLSSRFDAVFTGRRQEVHRGSYAIVD